MTQHAQTPRNALSVIAGMVGLAVLAACSPAPGVGFGEITPVATAANAPSNAIEEEAQLIAMINSERQQRGLPALSYNGQLYQAAQTHASDMSAKGYFAHKGKDGSSAGDRVKATGYNYCLVAENLSKGYQTPQLAVQGWMSSEGHRANILNPKFQDIGIGLAPGGLRVAVFGSRC